MPYQVYFNWLFQNVFPNTNTNCLNVLEIGTDHGQGLIPICHYLTVVGIPFHYDSIDIKENQELKIILNYFMVNKNQKINYEIANSLNWLPNCKKKYDLILVDGDHNYHTVIQELEYCNKISKDGTIIICDDYRGKWSEKDLFYADREAYSDNLLATKAIETDKHGVKAAVDEFLEFCPEWKFYSPREDFEAVVLIKGSESYGLKKHDGN